MATRLAPLLNVRNGKAAVEFYEAALGAVTAYRIDDPDGAVVARLEVGEAEFWVADESVEYGNPSPETVGGGTVRMILTVADPDALVDRAVVAGATLTIAVGEAHGWRLGRVIDPFGHHWEIGRPLEESE